MIGFPLNKFFSKDAAPADSNSLHLAVRAAICFFSISVLAFAIRKMVFMSGDYAHIGGDETWYLKLIDRILINGKSDIYYWLPGWPVFLSLFYEKGQIESLRHVTMVLASLNCGLVFLIGAQLWDYRSALIAGLIMCFFPEHIFFSHYLYAEIGLESFILLFTWLAFIGFKSKRQMLYFCLAFFVLGLGMLYKHFVIIPFMSLILVLFLKGQRKSLLFYSVVFITPLLLYAIQLKTQGRDPFFWFDIPIKNIREWAYHKPITFFDRSNKWRVTAGHIKRVQKKEIPDFLKHTFKNIQGLWATNHYVLGRVKYYKSINNYFLCRYIVILSYLALLFFGFVGLAMAPRSFFDLYAASNIVILSGLSFFWYLVPRFHLPFLFIFALYCGYALCHLRHAKLLMNT